MPRLPNHWLKDLLRPWVHAFRLWRDQLRGRLIRRRNRHIVMIVVSGSCGKTTTKELVAQVLSKRYRVHKTPGNWNALRFGGVLGTLQGLQANHEIAVVEAAIEFPGDMRRIVRILQPDMAIMLGVAPNHLSAFGDIEHIAQEKTELVRAVRSSGWVFLNTADHRVAQMRKGTSASVVTVAGADADVVCTNLTSTGDGGLQLQVRAGSDEFIMSSPLLGEHWQVPILMAVAIGRHFDIEPGEITAAVAAVTPPWARMQPITLPTGVTFIRDEFHASKHNYEVAFAALKSTPAKRKILVTSLYTNSSDSEEQAAQWLARQAYEGFDCVYFVGGSAAVAQRMAIDEGMSAATAFACATTAECAEQLKGRLQSGDLVLLKGRTHLHLSRIYLALFGPVRCTEHWCNRQYLCDRCEQLGFDWQPKLRGYVAPPSSMM